MTMRETWTDCGPFGASSTQALPSRAYLEDLRRAIVRVAFFAEDVRAIWRKDPALRGHVLRALEIPLYASFWALLFYRVAHALQATGLPFFPRTVSFSSRNSNLSATAPGRNRVSPGLSTTIRRIIREMMTSMCLSLIFTFWLRYTF